MLALTWYTLILHEIKILQTAGSSHGASHSVDDRRDESDDDDDSYHESSEDDDDDDDETMMMMKMMCTSKEMLMPTQITWKEMLMVGKSWKEMLMMKKPSKAIHDKHCIDIDCDIKSPTEASSS